MQWIKIDPPGLYSVIVGMDPAADWLLGPGIDRYLPGKSEKTLIPCIMRFQDEEAINSLMVLLRSGAELYITPWYLNKSGFLRSPFGYFTALARKGFFDELATTQDGPYKILREADKVIKLCSPQDPSALPNLVPGEPYPEIIDPGIKPRIWDPDTVVIGIIDDGIAFAHERFRKGVHDTRIESFWHQDGNWDGVGVPFGKEIPKSQIDMLLQQCTVSGSVDEDCLYRRAGLIDFADDKQKSAARRGAHGTHVLDLAAGADMNKPVTTRPIIAVQLQSALTADTSGANLEDKLLEGIQYILERADDLAGVGHTLPVVINFSYGLIAGPHDGTTIIEKEFDNFIDARAGKLRIVLPAGNSHLSRCHAEVEFPGPGGEDAVRWRVQPDDRTSSTVEIWLPTGDDNPLADDRMQLSIVTPSGLASPRFGETDGAGVALVNDNGQKLCLAIYSLVAESSRGLFRIDLQPTARLEPAATPALAPSGLWTIRLHNLKFGQGKLVQAWIQRDDTPYGYPLRGRQSYFDEPCYVRFDAQGFEIEDDDHPEQGDCIVTRKSLVNAIATGEETVVVGGFVGLNNSAARYSAGGMVKYHKPHALLVSDDSKVHSGVLAAGSHSGSLVAFTGTSVAAPQITRWIASKLASTLPDHADVTNEALSQDAPPPPLPPSERGGKGRISQVPDLPIVPLPR